MRRAASKSPPRTSFVLVLVVVLLLAPCARSGPAGDIDLDQLPPAATGEVSFRQGILPLLERSCLRCHGAEKPRSRYRLDNRADALASGSLLEEYNEKLPPDAARLANIMPGDSRNSPLIHYVARLPADADLHMPPEGRAEPLTAAEVGLVRAWIDRGALWDDAPPAPVLAFSVMPAVRFITVDGNEQVFRQHTGLREGWAGGLTEFSLKQELDPKTTFTADGRVIGGDEDYELTLGAERQDLGFLRTGFSQWQSYSDDTGGYYAPWNLPALNRGGEDLYVEHQAAFFEAGLRRPDLPEITIRYDYESRQGDYATTQWGGVSGPDGGTKNIYPNLATVDEELQQIMLNVTALAWTVNLQNESRLEWWNNQTRRANVEQASPPFDYGRNIRNNQQHWQAANTLTLDKRLKDWCYVSGGYLYSHMEGQGFFSLENFLPSDPTLPPTLDAEADDITLRRDSHIINANTLLGPWKDLHFNAGVQSDWTRREGFAGGSQFTLPVQYDSNSDRAATEANAGLRYTGLPWTTLWAEGRLLGENYDYYEEGLTDGASEFLRDSDATGSLGEARTGFTVSPWKQVSLQAAYKFRDRSTDFDHPRDQDLTWQGNGYPAFILSRDALTHGVDVRLTGRPLPWLRTSLKWSLADTDYDTETMSATNIFFVPERVYPGGSIQAATYGAQTVQAGLVLTPWPRLYLAPTYIFTTSSSESALDGYPQVAAYEGDTHTVLATATYALSEKMDLLASYLFSTADYSQDNAAGLPLGIEYTRHGVTAGFTRRMRKNVTATLQYAFWTYDEPSRGGAADYTAQGFFASARWTWE
ncbi:MAG: hypothetical protein ACKVYV_05940 [Limisphaerales bacterium]